MKTLYTITGVVKKGAQNGQKFGYPTANVSLETHIPEGVYASHVIVNGQTYNAGTFIGSAKTFGDQEYKSESNIYNFEQDIYGAKITVHLFKRIRGNQNFINEKTLIAQMAKDTRDIKAFFKTTS